MRTHILTAAVRPPLSNYRNSPNTNYGNYGNYENNYGAGELIDDRSTLRCAVLNRKCVKEHRPHRRSQLDSDDVDVHLGSTVHLDRYAGDALYDPPWGSALTMTSCIYI
jgi:hypothetical protein